MVADRGNNSNGGARVKPEPRVYFSAAEYARRLDGVRAGLERQGLDALICAIHWNQVYLAGLGVTPHHYKVIVVPKEGEPIGVIRGLEVPGAKSSSTVRHWIPWSDDGDPTYMSLNPAVATAGALGELGLEGKRVGIETGIARFINHMTVAQLESLKTAMPRTEFVDDGNIVMGLRVIKSEAEIECMRRAAVITEVGALEAIDHIRPGRTQATVYAAVASKVSSYNESDNYELYLQGGSASGLIHVPGRGYENIILPGDVVFLELGTTVGSYFNTRIRCIHVGAPSLEVKRLDRAILRGLDRAIETIRPGVTSGDVDAAYKAEIAEEGYGNLITQRLGYSVGLGWNEGEVLSLRPRDGTVLKPGMVFHVVPGLYRPELGFGLGYSENVLVTEDGCECIDAGILERKLYIK
jgi:Xaa-Pro aminopeptidase